MRAGREKQGEPEETNVDSEPSVMKWCLASFIPVTTIIFVKKA